MSDPSHKWTDRQILMIEARIHSVYTQSKKELEKELTDFLGKYAEKDKANREKVEKGEWTEAQYKSWQRGQVFQTERFKKKIANISKQLTETNKTALGIVNKAQRGVFAYNANYAAYQIEKAGKASFGFEMYDESTVKRMLRDDPEILPQKEIDEEADDVWNTKLVNQQVTVGIVKGDSIPKIAARIASVTGSDERSSTMYARTAMTAAQNAGRIESYERAEDMGIKLKKRWVATLDSRTRDLHAKLDGQVVDIDKPFEVDGYTIMYPGDPSAAPEMVYNCRCTMVTEVEEYPLQKDENRYDSNGNKVEQMSYAEWAKSKGK